MARRKSKPKHVEDNSDGTPSDSEWMTMEPHENIAVCTEDSAEYPFCLGDTVALLSPDGKRDNWYGKIEDIRQRNGGDDDVWLKVRWYYSPEEVDKVLNGPKRKGKKKSGTGNEKDMVFDPEYCSPMERILSDHCDIIHSFSLEAVVNMPFFDESDLLEQKDILRGQLFCRYTLSVHPSDAPKLFTPVPPCLCSRGYNLSQSDPSQAMRVCAECKRAWHHTCLLNGGFSEDVGIESILYGMLSGQQYAERNSTVDVRPKKKRKLNSDSHQEFPSQRFLSILKRIPPSLLLLAAQPLIRGSWRSIPLPIPLPSLAAPLSLSPPSKHSTKLVRKPSSKEDIDSSTAYKYTIPKALPITGNVRAVTRARRKLRSLALVLGRTNDDHPDDEENVNEDEDDTQTQPNKRKLSNGKVTKSKSPTKSAPKSKGKGKGTVRGRPQTKGKEKAKGKGKGRQSRSKARSNSDAETDLSFGNGIGDLSREEEDQVLQELEVSEGSPPASFAPPSPTGFGPVSSLLLITRPNRPFASSSRQKPVAETEFEDPKRQEVDAGTGRSEWEPEPGWERFIVTPIRLPLVPSGGMSGFVDHGEEDLDEREEGAPTRGQRRVTRRTTIKESSAIDTTIGVSRDARSKRTTSGEKDRATTTTVAAESTQIISSPTRVTRSAAASEAKVLRSRSITRPRNEMHVALPMDNGRAKGRNGAIAQDGGTRSGMGLSADGEDEVTGNRRGRGNPRKPSNLTGDANDTQVENAGVETQYIVYPPAPPSSFIFASEPVKVFPDRSRGNKETKVTELGAQGAEVLGMFKCPGCGALI